MPWDKPDVEVMEKPIAPRKKSWLWGGGGIVLLFLISFVFFYRSVDFYRQIGFWLFGMILPLVLVIIAYFIRYYFYVILLDKYYFWTQESQKIQEKWQEWGESKIQIIGAFIKVSEKINESQLINLSDEMEMKINQAIKLERGHIDKIVLDMFDNIRDTLYLLPYNLFLKIRVFSSPASEEFIYNIEQAYQNFDMPFLMSIEYFSLENPSVHLFDLVDNDTQYTVHLNIINHACGDLTTAFLASFILMNEELYQILELGVPYKKLYRPMEVADLKVDIIRMMELQASILDSKLLLFTGVDIGKQNDILKILSHRNEMNFQKIIAVDSILGKQHPLSYWFSIALSYYLCENLNIPILIVADSDHLRLTLIEP